MSVKELLTADEAAKLLKIARPTLLRWARERKIESVRVSSKVVLFTAEGLESFLTSRTLGVEPTTSPQPTPATRNSGTSPRQHGKKNSRNQSWQDLRKEVLSWIEQDKK